MIELIICRFCDSVPLLVYFFLCLNSFTFQLQKKTSRRAESSKISNYLLYTLYPIICIDMPYVIETNAFYFIFCLVDQGWLVWLINSRLMNDCFYCFLFQVIEKQSLFLFYSLTSYQ